MTLIVHDLEMDLYVTFLEVRRLDDLLSWTVTT